MLNRHLAIAAAFATLIVLAQSAHSQIIKLPDAPKIDIKPPTSEDFERELGNAGGEIKRAWDNIKNLNPAGVSEEAWGEAGRVAYTAGAAIMAKRSPTGEGLPDWLKERLRPFYGDLVDKVTIHWATPTLDEWAASRFKISLTGTESEAQTYGYDIYTRWKRGEHSDKYIFNLMSHELMHSRQYEGAGKSLSNFGYKYFKEYKKADQNYENNKLENEAYEFAPRIVNLENKARGGKFIDVDGKKETLMPLQKYTRFGGCDWILTPLGGGYVSLENWALKGKYLDVDGRGDAIMLAPYTKFGGCDWKLEKIGGGGFTYRDLGTAYYSLKNKFFEGKGDKSQFLDIDGKTNALMRAPYTNFGGCDWRIDESR